MIPTHISRWLVFLATMTLLAAPAKLAVAQEATPTAETLPPTELDLAALTLAPSDLAELGITGFGLANPSSLRDAESDAYLQVTADPVLATILLGAYREAGFRSRYVSSLLRPRIPVERLPGGFVAVDQRINTAIAEYQTAEGAAAIFAFQQGSLDEYRAREVVTAAEFGDESEVTLSRGIEQQTGDRLVRVELTFRVDNLIADVVLTNHESDAIPDLALVEQLGAMLLSRIEQRDTRGTPHLSMRALRISPLIPWIEAFRTRDFYIRLDGMTEVSFAEIAAALREGREPPVPSRVIAERFRPHDTYMFWTPVGQVADPLTLPLYVTWLDRYESAQSASDALRGVSTDLGPGYVDVRELFVIVEPIGDGSRAFAYAYEGDPAAPVRGYVVIAQVGDALIRMQIDGPEGVRLQGVIELAARQAACVAATEPCPLIPLPEVEAAILPGSSQADTVTR